MARSTVVNVLPVYADLAVRTREVVDGARALLPDEVVASEDLGSLSELLRAQLRDGSKLSPDQLAVLGEHLLEAGELESELREHEVGKRLDALGRIHDALAELRELESPEALIERAPGALAACLDFDRTMISRVRGSLWCPEVLHIDPDIDPNEDQFRAYVDQREIPLRHMLLETELVRRRAPALVEHPETDPHTYKDIVTASGSTAYVVAPIMPTGRVIGFLHADRVDRVVDESDKENLWVFAEHFGFLFERAVLLERLAEQRQQLRRAFRQAEVVVDELSETELRLSRQDEGGGIVARTAASMFATPVSRIESLLTEREREVLALMTAGATNTRIAKELVISEGTVKSHVKHILRKLRASSRAEAVARFLQMQLREQRA